MKRFVTLTTVGLVVALLIAACGGGGDPTATPAPTATPQPTATPVPGQPTSTPAPTSTPQPTITPVPTATVPPTITPTPEGIIQRGGVLVQGDGVGGALAINSFQDGIRNPLWGPANGVSSRLVYQTLFHNDPYNNNVFEGILVDTWVFSASADKLTIQLKPEAIWADGMPVIAQDVKFTIDTIVNPPEEFTSGRNIRTSVASTAVIDERSLEITLNGPDVSFLSFVAEPSALIRPAHRTLEQSAREPMGSGAFELIDIQDGVKFTFINNPRYWLKDSEGGQLPYLNGVENIIIPDPSRAYAAILTGQLDMLNTIWRTTIVSKIDDINRRMPTATQQFLVGGSHGWGVRNKAPFTDLRVTKALNIITDRLLMVELAFAGFAVIDGAGAMPASSGLPWALPMDEIMSTPGWRYLNRNTGELELDVFKVQEGGDTVYEKDPADIATAMQLLDEVGLIPFPDITIASDNIFEPRAVVIAGMLQELLGNKVTLDIVDISSNIQRIRAGNFDVVVWLVHTGTAEPSISLGQFLSDGGFWDHGFDTSALDALHVAQKSAIDPAERKEIIFEFQRRIMEGESARIPVVNSRGPGGLAREWVRNVAQPVVTGSNTYSLDRTWLAER